MATEIDLEEVRLRQFYVMFHLGDSDIVVAGALSAPFHDGTMKKGHRDPSRCPTTKSASKMKQKNIMTQNQSQR